MKHRRLRAIIIILAIFLLPFSVEIAARTLSPRQAWIPLLQRIGSKEVVNSMLDFMSRPWGENDFKSNVLNVQNDERITVGQPLNAAHDIYVFGSSTTFGFGNDDKDTLPSQLQKLLPMYRVHNRGVISLDRPPAMSLLRKIPLRAGDIVIYYSGVAELSGVASTIDQQQFDFCRWLLLNANDIIIFHWLCDDHITPARLDAGNSTLDSYRQSIEAARTYVQSQSADFYNFLEPVMGSYPLSAEERLTASYEPIVATALAIYPEVYSYYKAAGAIDISHVLDADRANGVEVYVDNWHLNATGNAIVARAIRDAIWRSF